MKKIFISYRRTDSSTHVDLLKVHIDRRFGRDSRFVDIFDLEPGDVFDAEIDRALRESRVALVVIGPHWLDVADESGRRRIMDPQDYVRREIEGALAHNLTIVPILVDGASMPSATDLPPSLEPLTRRHALEMSRRDYEASLRPLFQVIDRELGSPRRTNAVRLAGCVLGTIAVVVAGWVLLPAPPVSPPGTPSPSALASPTSAQPVIAISPTNADRVAELARHGAGTVNRVRYSASGKLMAVASSYGLYMYDAESLQRLRFVDLGGYCTAAQFSPNDELIAVAAEKDIQVLRASDLSSIRRLTGHTDWVRAVAFSPDGSLLATGSDDRTIRIWRVGDGAAVSTLTGHAMGVTGVGFSGDGRTLATSSGDGTVRLWRLPEGAEVAALRGHQGWVSSLSISPDASTIATASADRTVRLWRLRDHTLLRTLYRS